MICVVAITQLLHYSFFITCFCRFSRVLLQLMLHTSLQHAETANTLARQLAHYNLRRLALSGDLPSLMQAEGPNAYVSLFGLLWASCTSSATAKATHRDLFETFCYRAYTADSFETKAPSSTRSGSASGVQYPRPLSTATTCCKLN